MKIIISTNIECCKETVLFGEYVIGIFTIPVMFNLLPDREVGFTCDG